jgi:dienelactone hydrolase
MLALILLALPQTPEWTQQQPLPAPSGRFPVGVTVAHFVDSTRPTSRHLLTRPLTVQVWYPAKRTVSRSHAPYLSEPGLLDSMMMRKYLDLSPDEMPGWAHIELPAVPEGTPETPPTSRGWPVLLLSHGLGVARAQYSALSEELASRGYIVLALDHPLGGFTLAPDGKVLTPGVDSVPLSYADHPYASVVRDWAIDATFVLRRMPNRVPALVLDTTRAGMLGHSLGGAAALQACRSEAVFRACADMDGYPFGDVEQQGVGRPFLVLLSQPGGDNTSPPRDSAEANHRRQFAQMGRERDSSWAAICAHDSHAPCFIVKMKGTGHMSFSDAPFVAPVLLRDVGATLSPARMHRLIADKLLEFFDHFLRGPSLFVPTTIRRR